MPYDFRSDTVTKPTEAMYRAMSVAELGDDVLGDDPTVKRLEEHCAEMLDKEAALFVPSGTMANLLAVFLHCRPGDELLCEDNSHVYIYEQGGYAQINSVCVRPLPGRRGIFDAKTLVGAIHEPNLHFPNPKSVFLENTHNRGGGSIWPFETLEDVCRAARQRGLTLHLDGARLLNAVVATGRVVREWTHPFDTVSLCFSKGLGAPVGSVLAGPVDWIHLARRRRKVLGGGMRQSGILAAAALHALDHHVERLAEDHRNAQMLAARIREMPQDLIRLKYDATDTNMVFFEIAKPQGTAQRFCEELARHGVLMLPTGPTTVRAVTHLNVDATAVEKAAEAIADALGLKVP
ncbi:MAG TPA: low specificity L-threonine aldolase [Planctomycetaceae bacterium]|nr:low specificity L-threonine aldolase [Planctomycetaceae bacterium]